MKRYALFLVLFTLAMTISGCKKAEVNANSNSEVPVETTASQFSAITDPVAALTEGNRLFDDNQTELAIEAYKRAVELDPDMAEAYFKMGVAYALIEKEAMRTGTGDVVPGETVGNKVVKTNSDKMFEKAVTAYKKLIAKSPDDAAAHFNLGRAYNKLNKDEEAEKELEKAVKLKADDSEYQTELGGIRVKLAKYSEAIGPLKKALEFDPENSQAEEILEDAQAGAKRVEFNQPDPANTNKKQASNTVAGSNTNSNSATASNSSVKTPPSNSKSDGKDPKNEKNPKPTPKPPTKPASPRR